MLIIGNCVFHLFCALVCIFLCFYDSHHSGDLVSDGSNKKRPMVFVLALRVRVCVCLCLCLCLCLSLSLSLS